ncbi:MAG: hypothetical protein HY738_00670 [Bacteroidia bacterium]|nr:hypothetical protein [Bacteroidia bacterium]
MKTKLKFNNTVEQDDYIQSLSLKELKELNKSNKFLFQNSGDIIPENEIENLNLIAIDEQIQKLQLNELKKIFETNKTAYKIDEISIIEKAKITGLDKNVIMLIETKKEKATIEQIMVYCSKLHIPYQRLVPEFFSTKY